MTARTRIGILISGRGSNMQALLDACKQPEYPAETVVVLSNRPDAAGLKKAQEAGIAVQVIDHKAYDTRAAFEKDLDKALRGAGVEFVCNAGFMRLLSAGFVNSWRNRQLNIHPSLLPAFKGLHTHERAMEAGVRISGCTVHFVRTEMDSGPIVAQAAVPVRPDDTPDTLASRVLTAEHRLYPHALALVASGAAVVEGERVVFRDESAEGQILMSPGESVSRS